MAQFIDKSALVAEIKRRIRACGNCYVLDELISLHCSINSLEAKEVDLQEEPVGEDLGEAAKEYADNISDKIGYKLQLRRAVVYGAKWQEKQDQSTIELAEDHAMLAGMEKMENLKKLADAMYNAAQNMTTDASRLRKAMDEYHQYVVQEYYDKGIRL